MTGRVAPITTGMEAWETWNTRQLDNTSTTDSFIYKKVIFGCSSKLNKDESSKTKFKILYFISLSLSIFWQIFNKIVETKKMLLVR